MQSELLCTWGGDAQRWTNTVRWLRVLLAYSDWLLKRIPINQGNLVHLITGGVAVRLAMILNSMILNGLQQPSATPLTLGRGQLQLRADHLASIREVSAKVFRFLYSCLSMCYMCFVKGRSVHCPSIGLRIFFGFSCYNMGTAESAQVKIGQERLLAQRRASFRRA